MGWLVGAVGIEFAVHLISPADSVVLVSSLRPRIQLVGLVLWPRCGQLPMAREQSATIDCREDLLRNRCGGLQCTEDTLLLPFRYELKAQEAA
jgi:hypothetical protein